MVVEQSVDDEVALEGAALDEGAAELLLLGAAEELDETPAQLSDEMPNWVEYWKMPLSLMIWMP